MPPRHRRPAGTKTRLEPRRRRQGGEQRVEIERETGRRLARMIDIAAAAAELAAHAAAEQREGDAAVIFEAAMIGGIDGQREIGRRLADERDDRRPNWRAPRRRAAAGSRLSSTGSAVSTGPTARSSAEQHLRLGAAEFGRPWRCPCGRGRR